MCFIQEELHMYVHIYALRHKLHKWYFYTYVCMYVALTSIYGGDLRCGQQINKQAVFDKNDFGGLHSWK